MTSLAGFRGPTRSGGWRRKLQEWQGNTSLGRQDKRGSPVVIQAIDMACLPACLSVGSRAATETFLNNFNGIFGTADVMPSLVGRP